MSGRDSSASVSNHSEWFIESCGLADERVHERVNDEDRHYSDLDHREPEWDGR